MTSAVVRLDGGRRSAVFRVEGPGAGPVVVKLYPPELAWKLDKEAHVYGLLGTRLDGRVPQILAVDSSTRVLARPCLVMTALEGEPVLARPDALDAGDRTALAEQVGAFLRELHAVELGEFGYLHGSGPVPAHATNAGYVRRQLEGRLRAAAIQGFDAELLRAVERCLHDRAELIALCERPVLCHNDCHGGNVLAVRADGGWRLSGVVDFENAVAADPLFDLAASYALSHTAAGWTLEALMRGYGLGGDGRAAATCELYAVYHWLSLWVWFDDMGETNRLPELEVSIREVVHSA